MSRRKIDEVLQKLKASKRMDHIRGYYKEFSNLVQDIEDQRKYITDFRTAEVFHFATSRYINMSEEDLRECLKYKPSNCEGNPFIEEYHRFKVKDDRIVLSKMAKDDVDYYFYKNHFLSWNYEPDLRYKVEYFKWKSLLEETVDNSDIDKTSVTEVKKLIRSFKEGEVSAFNQTSLFGTGDYYDYEIIYKKYLDNIVRCYPEKNKREEVKNKREEMIYLKKDFIMYLQSGVNFFLDGEVRKKIHKIKRVKYKFFLNKMKNILDEESMGFIYKTKWVVIANTHKEIHEEAIRISNELWSHWNIFYTKRRIKFLFSFYNLKILIMFILFIYQYLCITKIKIKNTTRLFSNFLI